jgi:hypothetical protein
MAEQVGRCSCFGTVNAQLKLQNANNKNNGNNTLDSNRYCIK